MEIQINVTGVVPQNNTLVQLPSQGLTEGYVKISFQYLVTDPYRLIKYLNIKWGDKLDWEKTSKTKVEDGVIPGLKSHLRPLFAGTAFEKMLNDETKKKINGQTGDPTNDQKFVGLNNGLNSGFGIGIWEFTVEKPDLNDIMQKLLQGTEEEKLQRLREIMDQETTAELFRKTIEETLGFPKGTLWKDLDPDIGQTVRNLVLIGQEKINPSDTAIADAFRNLAGRFTKPTP
jgi:hypothetical protein